MVRKQGARSANTYTKILVNDSDDGYMTGFLTSDNLQILAFLAGYLEVFMIKYFMLKIYSLKCLVTGTQDRELMEKSNE